MIGLYVCLLALFISRVSATYNKKDALLSLNVACVSFCDPSTYEKSSPYNGFGNGLVNGLNVTMTIHENHYQTYGFVGYLPSDKAIYVVYRGTEGTLNWMDDAEIQLVPYTSFASKGQCADCKVHRGFYTALLADFDNVTKEVKRLKKLFPSYVVKTTGHSLGAALAQLASMELTARGITVSGMYNFGQPRTGNAAYATFSTKTFPSSTYRHVHYADPVPHVPPPAAGYTHICTEMYEPNEIYDGTIKQCGAEPNNCEASGSCMDVWKDKQLNTQDHLVYLGLVIKCLW